LPTALKFGVHSLQILERTSERAADLHCSSKKRGGKTGKRADFRVGENLPRQRTNCFAELLNLK